MKKTITIAKVLITIMITAIFVSCGTTRKTTKSDTGASDSMAASTDKSQALDLSGNYSWIVTGIPDGDQSGSMSLKKNGTTYTGELGAMGMSVPIDEIKVVGNKMTGYIAVQDMGLDFSIVFDANGFKGNIYAGENGFPFIGKKEK